MATTFPEHSERQYQSHLKHLKLQGLRPKTIEAYARGMRRMGEYLSYQVDALSCGEQRSMPHSCGDRSCPHCQHHEAQVWIERQTQLLVPADYFMLTVTLPAELRGLAWGHQRVVYALLMQCAWDTLYTFSLNDAKLGATPGAVGVLHTHSRRLEFHPHVHMVMPAAALDAGRKLRRTKVRRSRRGKSCEATLASGGYLFNHKAPAEVFRAKALDAFERAGLALPAAVPAASPRLNIGRVLPIPRAIAPHSHAPGNSAPQQHPGGPAQRSPPDWPFRMYLQCPEATVGALRHGLVQQTDQIAASRDLSLIVRAHLLR